MLYLLFFVCFLDAQAAACFDESPEIFDVKWKQTLGGDTKCFEKTFFPTKDGDNVCSSFYFYHLCREHKDGCPKDYFSFCSGDDELIRVTWRYAPRIDTMATIKVNFYGENKQKQKSFIQTVVPSFKLGQVVAQGRVTVTQWDEEETPHIWRPNVDCRQKVRPSEYGFFKCDADGARFVVCPFNKAGDLDPVVEVGVQFSDLNQVIVRWGETNFCEYTCSEFGSPFNQEGQARLYGFNCPKS